MAPLLSDMIAEIARIPPAAVLVDYNPKTRKIQVWTPRARAPTPPPARRTGTSGQAELPCPPTRSAVQVLAALTARLRKHPRWRRRCSTTMTVHDGRFEIPLLDRDVVSGTVVDSSVEKNKHGSAARALEVRTCRVGGRKSRLHRDPF